MFLCFLTSCAFLLSEMVVKQLSILKIDVLFFISGLLDNVTVLIGIAYGGRAIAGVINQPFYNYQVN